MIDHEVIIGGADVSMEVVKVEVEQSMDTDSEPGKMTVTLANRHQMYSNKWPPQVTPMRITLFNWVYRDYDGNPQGKSMATYLVATGKMTDNSSDHKEAVVVGECDLGHLADALPNDVDKHMTTPKETLAYVLSKHKDYEIQFYWDPALDSRNRWKERETYGSDWTFQDFLEDLCSVQIGAVYFFSEENILQIKDPYSSTGLIDLDPYVKTPMQTTSVQGFRNGVVVIGDESKEKSKKGISVSGSQPIISEFPHGFDLDSIEEVGWLFAPVFRDANIKTVEEANTKADELLRFYKINKNALTEVEVVGIVPPMQSVVEYTPFIPISPDEIAKMNAYLADLIKILQDKENEIAIKQDRDARTITLSSKIRGIVVSKKVEYSIDGLNCKCTISPGLVDGVPIKDDDVSGSVLNWTEINEDDGEG